MTHLSHDLVGQRHRESTLAQNLRAPPHDPWGDQRPAHQVIARDMPIGLRLKVGDVVKCALEVLHGELGWLGSA